MLQQIVKLNFQLHKMKVELLTLEGDTNNNRTYATFIRLGDT
jgi:hypothetical protein